MVRQMLATINLATSALHDRIRLLTAGFKGTTFVHSVVGASYIFCVGKYPFYITSKEWLMFHKLSSHLQYHHHLLQQILPQMEDLYRVPHTEILI